MKWGEGMYVGHTRGEDGAQQPLFEHLKNTARLAGAFAGAFGAQEQAYRMGLMHDLGKYAFAAQARQRDPEHTRKVDHASLGALVANELGDLCAAIAVSGHHGGLRNLGSWMAAVAGDGSVCGCLKKPKPEGWEAYRTEVQLPQVAFPEWLLKADRYALQFYTRMLFSCLVDADFLDTEAFMRTEPITRGGGLCVDALFERLRAFTDGWEVQKTPINQKRAQILAACYETGRAGARGLYSLSVPTGGGKTIGSLAFALAHARAQGLRRVIYVVPYMNIIDQTVARFSEILGEEQVLAHHSGMVYQDDALDAADVKMARRRLATENWDAPVVVTTAVQFFESLHARRTSQCRKLHNIAKSVLIFDEAQMMPTELLAPCVAAIAELVEHYGATAVLCTATQPKLDELFETYAPGLRMREIAPDPPGLYAFFRRVTFKLAEKPIADAELARQVGTSQRVLCIVNSRKRAQAIYDRLAGEADARFHLSTLMTPNHRRRTLEIIRERLKNGLPCRVIATSLVEAGVDLDFDTVWREEAGLDSILQAAGRCNREGRRKAADSIVWVFAAEGNSLPVRNKQVGAMHTALDRATKEGWALDDPRTIEVYFDALMLLKKPFLDMKNVLEACKTLAFKDVSERFRMIEAGQKTVYIPTPENGELLHALREGRYSRALLRKLALDGVSVYERDYLSLGEAGLLEQMGEEFAILANTAQYDGKKGLSLLGGPGVAKWDA